MTTAPCPICTTQSSVERPTRDRLSWNCPRCGSFSLTGTAEAILRATPFLTPAAISGWIRFQNYQGIEPSIDSDQLKHLRDFSKPTFGERAERYLATVVSNNPKLNSRFLPLADELIGASYSDDDGEVGVILEFLKTKHFIIESPDGQLRISAEGRIAADEMRSRRANSSQAFVAMWFGHEVKDALENGIGPAIRSSGYDLMIINRKEHANKIDDEIIAEIRRSAFVVADFTGHRGGVYFEAGFAMGLGLQVIWTCRQDHLKDLHFDIRQYNCIDWKDAGDLAIRLQRRIEAMRGRGPKVLG